MKATGFTKKSAREIVDDDHVGADRVSSSPCVRPAIVSAHIAVRQQINNVPAIFLTFRTSMDSYSPSGTKSKRSRILLFGQLHHVACTKEEGKADEPAQPASSITAN